MSHSERRCAAEDPEGSKEIEARYQMSLPRLSKRLSEILRSSCGLGRTTSLLSELSDRESIYRFGSRLFAPSPLFGTPPLEAGDTTPIPPPPREPPPRARRRRFFGNICGKLCGTNHDRDNRTPEKQPQSRPDLAPVPAPIRDPQACLIHDDVAVAVPFDYAPPPIPYLGLQRKQDLGKKTLVLDLDETLVHSTYSHNGNHDFIVPAEVEGQFYDIFVAIRPGVSQFLSRMYDHYELVIFTASLAKYAKPVMDFLDPNGLCAYRLFRECCTYTDETYVKDLSKLGRDLRHTIIVDNSPKAFCLQPYNGIRIRPWYDDPADTELVQLIPILEQFVGVDDIPRLMMEVFQGGGEDKT